MKHDQGTGREIPISRDVKPELASDEAGRAEVDPKRPVEAHHVIPLSACVPHAGDCESP